MRVPSWIWWPLCAVLLAGAMVVRWDPDALIIDGEVRIYDPDTLRRLTRLHNLDEAESYPVVERQDGFPDGTVHHWTLPMDWVIRGLDPLVSWLLPAKRPYEAGASLAGPVLAALSILAMLLIVRRLLGRLAALLAGSMYAFSYSCINVSWLGNGDHQNLQHLCLVVSLTSCLLALKERAVGWIPIVSGAALGLAIWISTESLLFYYVSAAGLFAHSLFANEAADAKVRLQWGLALLGAVALGHVVEQPDLGAVELDKVSLLQVYQAGVFAVFALLVRVLPVHGIKRPLTAGAVALVLGALPLPLLQERLDAFATVNLWLRTEVLEFRGLFVDNDLSIGLRPALERESWLLFVFPLLLAGVAFATALPPGARALLIVLGAGTFGLEVWERKLGHVFSIVFPIVVVAGGLGIRDRFLPALSHGAKWTAHGLCALAVGHSSLSSLPVPFSETFSMRTHEYKDQLSGVLRDLDRKRRDRSVLAPWEMGAWLMYYCDMPVVGSNYHRNMDGILDTYRVYLARPGETLEARRILRRRKVRYVVADYNRTFLRDAPPLIGRQPLAFGGDASLEFSEGARETLFWKLRFQDRVPGFRLVYTGETITMLSGESQSKFKIWEFLD